MAEDDKGGADVGADKSAADQGADKTILNTGAADQGADKSGADKSAADAGADKGAGEDWRDKVAAGDATFRKQLDRYSDFESFGKAHRALALKLSSGEYRRQLPEGASDEEKATWRKENGIPEKPEGYIEKLSLPDGLVIGEADKPIVAEFAAAALDGDVTPAQYSRMVAKYYEIQDAQKAIQEDNDAKFKQESDDALRAEWPGAEYRQNLTAINNMTAQWPEGLAARVLAARTPDGKLMGNDPTFIKQLATLARELNPAATLVPAGTTDAGKGVAERINELKAMMPDRQSAYWKGPQAEALQAEYRQLLEADEKIKARAA